MPPAHSNYDPMRAVKRLLLEFTQRLDIAKIPHHALTVDDVDGASDAAKALRIRMVREYDRVRVHVQKIKQRLYASESQRELREAGGGVMGRDDDDDQLPSTGHDTSSSNPQLLQARLKQAIQSAMREDQSSALLRSEYLFLGELRVMERVVVPALVAHALRHPTTLLPQLLKLLAAMTLPVINDVNDTTQQLDVLAGVRVRCSCDDFFVLIVHAIAPVASRRREGPLPFHDAVLLEVVLNLISNLLRGPVASVEPTVGAMCRNHGVELVLVLLTQNFQKFQDVAAQQEEEPPRSEVPSESQHERRRPVHSSSEMIVLGDDDDDNEEEEEELVIVKAETREDTVEEQCDDIHKEETAPPFPLEAPLPVGELTPPSSVAAIIDSTRAETQLVVLPDSQYDDFMRQHQGEVHASLFEEDTIAPEVAVDNDGVIEFDFDAPVAQATTTVGDDERSSSSSTSAVEEEEGEEEDAKVMSPPRASSDESSVGSETTDDDDDEEEDEEHVTLLDDEAEEGDDEEEEGEDDGQRPADWVRRSARIAELAGELQRETLDSIQRLNDYLLEIVALVFRCAPASDLSMLALSLQNGSSNGVTSVMASIQALQAKVGSELRHQRQVDNSWRMIAKSRNGAFATNSILVRKISAEQHAKDQQHHRSLADADMPPPRPLAVLGATSTLMGGKRMDALGFVKEQDRRKKGRYNRKMLEPLKPVSALPLPTQMHLAQQFSTFLAHGFESLSTMIWPRVQVQLKRLNEEVEDASAATAGYGSRLDGPLLSALENVDVKEIMNYFFLCFTLLRFTRINLRYVLEWRREMDERNKKRQEGLHRDRQEGLGFGHHADTTVNLAVPQVSLAADGAMDEPSEADQDAARQQEELMMTFEAQWKAVSHIITLEHIQAGFTLIRNFTTNKELATDYDIGTPLNFVSELLLLLVHLLDGDIVQDPAVTMAAHAMGSSLLYQEENISVVYFLVGNVTFRNRPTHDATQSLITLLHALLSLIDKCSFNGTLALPKRKAPQRRRGQGGRHEGDGDDVDGGEPPDEEEDDAADVATHDPLSPLEQFLVDDDHDSGEEEEEGTALKLPADDHSTEDAATRTTKDGGAINDDAQTMMMQLRSDSEGGEDAVDAPLVDVVVGDDHLLRRAAAAAEDDDEVSVRGDLEDTTGRSNDQGGEVLNNEVEARLGQGELDGYLGPPGTLRARSHESEESGSVVLSSRTTGNTSMTSEREVRVQEFYLRLSTPKYVPIIYYGLCHWRTNDGDTNHAICTMLQNLLNRSIGISAVFCFPFLLVFHEILSPASGAAVTHRPLFDVADRIVFQMFNPSFAKSARPLFDATQGNNKAMGAVDEEQPDHGPMSSFGTEVAFRCTRAFFLINPSHYVVLEEAALQQSHAFDMQLEPEPTHPVKKTRRTTFADDKASSESDEDIFDNEHRGDSDDDDAAADQFLRDASNAVLNRGKGKRPRVSDTTPPARRGRPRRNANADDAPSTYVMGSNDVSAIAKEVDRKIAAEAKRKGGNKKRQSRRRSRSPSSSHDEANSSVPSDAAETPSKAHKSSKKAVAAPKTSKRASLTAEEKQDRKRRRKDERTMQVFLRRREKLLGDDALEEAGAATTEGSSYAPGSIVTGDDGALYMVHNDGYAYQVVCDEATGAYTFVDGA